MPDKYLYLLVDTFCVIFPAIFSFHKRIAFYRQWRYFFVPCVITATLFVAWDVIFTARGIWSFNPRYVVGLYLWRLPIEEYLFFLCIPYACVFTYYSITNFFSIAQPGRRLIVFTWGFSILLFVAALLFYSKLYTSVTFTVLGATLAVLAYKKAPFLKGFYISYCIILLPFYISNGVLTGLVTPEPVVMYNNEYNLGIRTLTIPIEDIFYGMAMLLLNVAGFEYMKTKSR